MRPYARIGLLLFLALPGCTWLLSLQSPPFSVAGAYSGTWTAQIPGSDDAENTCTVTLALEHDPEAAPPANTAVEGIATFKFTCPNILDEIAYLGLPATISLPLTGALLTDGHMYFVSAGTGGGGIHYVTMDLVASDHDGDGEAETIAGDFMGSIHPQGFDSVRFSGSIETEK